MWIIFHDFSFSPDITFVTCVIYYYNSMFQGKRVGRFYLCIYLVWKSKKLCLPQRLSYLMDLSLQVWNHDFFWESMQPGGGDMPSLGLLEQIEKDFGSFTNFKEKFLEAALTLFGSGWVWLVCKTLLHRILFFMWLE